MISLDDILMSGLGAAILFAAPAAVEANEGRN